jgi:3',5'-cyclic AMP phosphodiesterase CpdA
VHHPPLPGQCASRKALGDAAELARLLEHHAVELVLHGHIHRNVAIRHAQRTQVLATASASNAQAARRASYRVLDITERSDRWVVDARLMTLDDNGSAACHDRLRCEFLRR